MQDAKEEVRSRLNLEDVIGEYVQLQRSGRNFKGLSPFSGEKTPSFYVSPEKGIWHDFSSNKGGDLFRFVMEVEGMDFRQALEQLARKAGVDLSLYQSQSSQQLARKKKRLLEANQLAANYYQHSLLKNPHALDYVVKKRGLSKEIIQAFQIGYAPEAGDALIQFLQKRGFSRRELSESGLTNRFGTDLFRGRMTVPLMDPSGQVIGFTGRIIAEVENAPKYLNTPQTLLYDKGRHVFGLSQAKEAIRTNEYSVIVEGNLDVVSSHQAGVKQVVATAGTAMTEHHLRSLKRFSSDIRLAFDGDKAGLAATERAIPIASAVGVDLTIISLPSSAKDPDELIHQDVNLWQQAIEQAQPAVDWLLARYLERWDVSTAKGKRSFSSAALHVISQLADPVEQEHYEKKTADLLGTSLESLRQKQASTQQEQVTDHKKPVADSAKQPVLPDEYGYQDNLLAVFLTDEKTQPLLQTVTPSVFEGEDRQAVVSYLQTHLGRRVEDTPVELQKIDTYVKILLLKAETRYADWSDKDRYLESARLLRQVGTEHIKRQKDILTRELSRAESEGDEAAAAAARATLNTLIKESHGQR